MLQSINKAAIIIFIGVSDTAGNKKLDEAVGVFCLESGKPSIIEYTEIPEILTK